MAPLMFLLAFVIAYPVFMILGYLLAKVIFTKIDSKEDAQRGVKKEKIVQVMRMRQVRVRRMERVAHA